MVLIEALDELTGRFRDGLPRDATGPLRARFEQMHKRALTRLRRDEVTIEAVRGELEAARERSARLDVRCGRV
jgi:hypothetical protein